MAPMTWLTFVVTFGGTAVLAAVRQDTRDVVTPINHSTSNFTRPNNISTTRETEHTSLQDKTKQVPINCSDTKSEGEVFSCILQGMLSEPILIGAGIVILLAALFVILNMLRSKPYRNGCKTVQINKDEKKKMMV